MVFKLVRGLNNFISYDDEKNLVSIDAGQVTKNDAGIHTLTFKLKDDQDSERNEVVAILIQADIGHDLCSGTTVD